MRSTQDTASDDTTSAFAGADHAQSDAPIALVSETLDVGRRVVETGRVRVEVTTQTTTQPVELMHVTTEVEVARHEINRMLDRDEATPQQTMRDGVTIIPILEEIVVAEKRLVLLAELHLTTRTTASTVTSSVALRKQTAEVTSWPADPSQNPPSTGD